MPGWQRASGIEVSLSPPDTCSSAGNGQRGAGGEREQGGGGLQCVAADMYRIAAGLEG